VVQAFEDRDRGIVPISPNGLCPSAGSARALAARLAQNHVIVIAWSRTGDPNLGDWSPPEVLSLKKFEAGGVVEYCGPEIDLGAVRASR
jgi:hypothetical protein